MVEIKIPLDNLKKHPIYVNAFEGAVLMRLIFDSDKRDALRGVFKQLLDLYKKLREEAGVTETDLGNGYIMLRDKDGTTIIRKKYEWEE